MLRLFILSIFLMLAQNSDPLKEYRWKNRVILVHHTSQNSTGRDQVSALIKDPKSIADRDLVILEIFPEKVFMGRQEQEIHSKAIREKFKLTADTFEVLLIGKDGGVKLRSDKLVSSGEIFGLIDSMPMRKAEMKNK